MCFWAFVTSRRKSTEQKQPRIRLQVFLVQWSGHSNDPIWGRVGWKLLQWTKRIGKDGKKAPWKKTIPRSWADIYVPDISIDGILSADMYNYSNYALLLVGGGLQSQKVDTEIMSFQPFKGLEEWWCFMANLAKPEKSAKIPKAADGLGDIFGGGLPKLFVWL